MRPLSSKYILPEFASRKAYNTCYFPVNFYQRTSLSALRKCQHLYFINNKGSEFLYDRYRVSSYYPEFLLRKCQHFQVFYQKKIKKSCYQLLIFEFLLFDCYQITNKGTEKIPSFASILSISKVRNSYTTAIE